MQSPNRRDHQLLYKSNKSEWKRDFRKRCIDRLKKNRSNLIDNVRGISEEGKSLSDFMIEEWTSSQKAVGVGNYEEDELEELSYDLFLDLQNEIMQEIQQEITQLDEGEQLTNDVISYESNSEVICPICVKSNLRMHKKIVYCKCGMKINTENDGIRLQDVKQNLELAMFNYKEHHATISCSNSPHFSVHEKVGIDMLMMSCVSIVGLVLL